jgi:uncharacterized protein
LKRFIAALWLAVSLLSLTPNTAAAQDYPRPVGLVNDFAGVLSPGTSYSIGSRLVALAKETGAEVALVTVNNLSGYSIEQYAVGLFESWGIGKSGTDNGVLLLLALNERKVKIEVGYGLEGIITDGRAGRILDNDVVPYLRKGDYDTALENGIADIEQYIRDGTPPTIVEENPVQKAIDNFRLPPQVIIVAGIMTIYVLGFMARTKSIWLGGIWGVILGIILGFGFGRVLYMFLLAFGLGIFGLILDIILSANYRGRSSSGLPTGWFSSGGGFRGSGGGFGGFGGGRSGGGGASRGW